MRYLEKHPLWMIGIGIAGISVSSIIVRLSEAPSVITALYRLAWTVLIMSPAVWGQKGTRQELLRVSRRTLLLSAASGCLLAVHFAAWFESLRHTSVAASTVIVSTEVLFVAGGWRVFMKGRLSRMAVTAILLALAGSVMIAVSDSAGGNGLYGDALALLAAAAVGGYTLLGRAVRQDTSTSVYTYIVYVFCTAGLALMAILQGTAFGGYGARSVLCGLMLAVFSTILGHSVFSWCLKYFSPAFVSAAKLAEPVAAGALAAVLFGEIPGVLTLTGGAVILTGVVLYSAVERTGNGI